MVFNIAWALIGNLLVACGYMWDLWLITLVITVCTFGAGLPLWFLICYVIMLPGTVKHQLT